MLDEIRGSGVVLTVVAKGLFVVRLAAIAARIDPRIALVRIDHATGRDVARGLP